MRTSSSVARGSLPRMRPVIHSSKKAYVAATAKGILTDGDGMPDFWEILYGFDPNNPNDAAGDADGDGLTNLQEFLLGSNPRDPADPLRIISIRTNGADFFVSFNTVAGRNYRVEYKNSLTDPTWLPIGADITADSTITEVPDLGALAGMPERFYRARLLP